MEAVAVLVVAGADGTFDLDEDRDDDAWARTPIRYDARLGRLRVGPVSGARAVVPSDRDLDVVLVGFGVLDDVRVLVGGVGRPVEPEPERGGRRRIRVGAVRPEDEVEVTLVGDPDPAGNDIEARVHEIVDRAHIEYRLKTAVMAAVRAEPDAGRALLECEALGVPDAVRSALVEVLLAT